MSIATAIQAAQQKIANAYTAISNKGGTLPATRNLSNMPAAINTIQTGITPTGTITISSNTNSIDVTNYAYAKVQVPQGVIPTGTKNITSNGSYDVTNYEYAYVNVSGGGGGTPSPFGELFEGEIDAQGNYTMPYDLPYIGNISFDGIKSIPTGTSAAGGMFASYLYHQSGTTSAGRLKCRLITGTVTFPDLETVSNASCFSSFCNGQSNITSVSFPKLTTISGGSTFQYAFQGCTSLTTVYFTMLSSISGSNFFGTTFQGCTSLTDIYFNSLTGNISASTALQGVTGCKVHLPVGYSGTCNLGGTNTVYLYDL